MFRTLRVQTRLAFALAGIASLSMACGSPAPSATTPATGNVAPAGGGSGKPIVNRAIMAVTMDVETNDPLRVSMGTSGQIQMRPIYDRLIGYDASTGKLTPELSDGWTVEEGGKALRFKLKKGIPFHDGAGEMTSVDVQTTFDQTMLPTSTQYNTTFFRAVIAGYDTTNPNEIVFKLKDPNAEFLNAISAQGWGGEIASKAALEKLGHPPTLQDRPIPGTGPYMFDSRVQGQYIRYKRVDYQHYRITPDFPEFEYRIINEASTRMASLLTGEIHMAPLPTDLQGQAQAQNMKIVAGKVAGLRTFFEWRCCYWDAKKNDWQFPDSPLLDVRVRKALNKAIDRQALNKAFFAGKGEQMYNAQQHPTREGWNPDWEKRFPAEYGYDQEAARKLLADAGYGPGKPLSTNLFVHTLGQYAGSADLIEAVAAQWRAVGVNVALQTTQPDQLTELSRRCANPPSNAAQIIGTSSYLILGMKIYNSLVRGDCGGYADKESDELFAKVSGTLDDKQRDEFARQWGNRQYDNFSTIPLFWLPAEIAVNPKFIAEYTFPGSVSSTWTHIENIKAVKQ